jgi:hypothetical protein
MTDDVSKKTNPSDETGGVTPKLEELPQKPISDLDAQSVKGGRRLLDEGPEEKR